MKFTIIITNFNHARFLRRCIDSVLEQSIGRVECIVVDDGSTDESRSILNSYDSIVKIFKGNTGQAHSTRIALSQATGDIVIFLDADDFLDANGCEKVAEKWTQQTSSVAYRLRIVDEDRITTNIIPTFTFSGRSDIDFLLKYGDLPVSPNSGHAYARIVAQSIFQSALNMKRQTTDCWLYLCA